MARPELSSVDYKLGTFDMVASPPSTTSIEAFYDAPAPEQIRLWVDGRCNEGPIRLLVRNLIEPVEGMSYYSWECEALWHQKIVDVPEFNIGRIMLPEEVLAWMAL